MGQEFIARMEQLVNGSRIVDLSYTLEPGMPVWPTHARFGAVVYETYDEGAVSMHRQLAFGEHSGTHIDAPKHFIKGGIGIDEVDVTSVIGRGVMIDASFLDPCQAYTLEHLKKFEKESGPVKEGDIILLRFGWEDKYALGQAAEEFLKDWPGLDGEAAQYLMEKKVSAVGSDAFALDPFGSEIYPCHTILLGNNIPILENLANLRQLPVFSYVIGLANKVKDGSGCPIRIIALVEDE